MKALVLLFMFILISLSFSLKAKECDFSSIQKKYKPKYAQHFSIDYYNGFKIVHVDGDAYLLSASLSGSKIKCRGDYQASIKTPVMKTAFMSTTYLPTLEILNKEGTLKAFQGKQYIVSKAFDKNKIKELSYKFNPEDLITLKADLIMGHTSNLSDSKQKGLLRNLGLPVVINKDFEETNPLARAEWIVFNSSFFDMEEKAVNVFNEIERNYLELKKENEKLNKTSVLVGSIENGFWVTCGGVSDLAQLIRDAGGALAFANNSKETQRVSLEELLKDKKHYKVWLSHNSWKSEYERIEMMKKDQRYKYIDADVIYNNNLISNDNGATDFWEMALQRPDWLLKDLSAILHEEKFPGHKLKWYRRL